MQDVVIAPFLLGLSAGTFCFAYCIPFIAPVIVSEVRNARENFFVLLKFILGRLTGYLLFGAVIGLLGKKINSQFFDLIIAISLMLLSALLIFNALGLLKPKNPLCAKIKHFNSRMPAVMGFLMGINVCPPFLMSLAYVFTLHSVFGGIIYFFMFFLGTTIYILPLFFLGFLNKIKEFQLAGRISALAVGILFFLYSVYAVFKDF